MRGLHHLHVRKRRSAGHEPFPARTWRLRLLDRIVLAAGVIGPMMTIPQIVKIFALHDGSGISVITWGMYAALDIPWIIYGLAHREAPIALTYTLWLIMNVSVVAGALFYGAGLF
ncbi:MAG TPA: hypothetical protein VI483_01305 [Candidatus Paceibacterota bacterium]